jgi:aspartyl-tRNA(Asn)/glutamyl-tRNA(Gln) amidotransferase subunit C
MIVDDKTVDKIAHLARLELSEAQSSKMKEDMNAVLGWMEKLNELDTKDVEPLIHMSHEMNVLRDDTVANEVTHEQGLKNAPKKDSNYFRVPKVVG